MVNFMTLDEIHRGPVLQSNFLLRRFVQKLVEHETWNTRQTQTHITPLAGLKTGGGGVNGCRIELQPIIRVKELSEKNTLLVFVATKYV